MRLIAGALALCLPLMSLAQEAAEDVVPGVPFKEGDVIGFEQLDKLKDYLPPEFWANREYFFYEGMELDIEEVDLFFVYPWPGEQSMMLKLFDAVAGEGAILIAYYGDRDICLYRKLEDDAPL